MDEILAMLKKGFEEAEVEVDEETDALLAEIDGSEKEEKNEKEEIASDAQTHEEATVKKTEETKPDGE